MAQTPFDIPPDAPGTPAENAPEQEGAGDRGSAGAEQALPSGRRVAREALSFSFARSSGPGGQNVNKRSTKAQLRVDVGALGLDPRARARLRRLARSMINESGELIIASEETRSQARNKEACLEKLDGLIARALTPPKVRKKTKPSKRANQRRLDEKKQRGETKRRRQERPE